MALYSLSICSGVGGLDLAIELAAPGVFTPIAMVEGEGYAASILAARMADKALPACPIWSNAKSVCDAAFRAYVRERTEGQGIDFVFGGIPCQPHSVAGKQLGKDDPRDLWPATVRILETLKPRLFFLENVPGMLGDVSARVVPDLQRIGYIVPRPLLLEAAHVGAPQRRERLFVLAYRPDIRREQLRPKHRGAGAGAGAGEGRLRESSRDCSELAISEHEFSDVHRRQCARLRHADRTIGEMANPRDNGRGRTAGQADECGRGRAGDRPSDVSGGEGRGEDQSDADAGTANFALGQPSGARRTKAGRGPVIDSESKPESARSDMGDGDGDGDGDGSQGRPSIGRFEAGGSSGIPYWPPGPADRDEWQRILAVRSDLAPAIESPICRAPDGSAIRMDTTRVDELRSLGNMVVPVQGAAAFLILLERLKDALPEV